MGCAQERVRSAGAAEVDASLAVSDADAPVPTPTPTPSTSASASASASFDAGSAGAEHAIVWDWKGRYDFVEPCAPAAPAAPCPRYRIVVDECPGPCKVHVDVDGAGAMRRLEGVGRGTSDRYQLEVRFTGYRPGDASKRGFVEGAVLLTLEPAPGDHMVLVFGKLDSANGGRSLIVRHPALRRARE